MEPLDDKIESGSTGERAKDSQSKTLATFRKDMTSSSRTFEGEASTLEQQKSSVNEEHRLTSIEIRHLTALVLAYACLVCQVTSIVGTSAVIVLSVGGSSSTAPFALGAFLFGSAIVSLFTSRIFSRGRKFGFLIGTSLGLFGAALGAIAIAIQSSVLVIISCFPMGASNGVGMYLRFAAVEVVPAHYKSFAITLVLSGGCIAAFAGPESVQATKDLFGDDLLFLGVFMMIAIFSVCQSISVATVQFESDKSNRRSNENLKEGALDENDGDGDADSNDIQVDTMSTTTTSLSSLIMSRPFLVSLSISTLAWTIMVMPMSVVRVAMGEVGFSSRQSLTVMELHFLSMYAPGFVTSRIIDRFGPLLTSALSIVVFCTAMPLNFVSESIEDGTRATWIFGLICLGIGWNLGFSSGTVLLTNVYSGAPSLKPYIEAANDFGMFLVTGSFTLSTGYIYDAGGSFLNGWKTVNYVVVGLIVVMLVIVVSEYSTKRVRAGDLKRKTRRLDTDAS